MSFDNILPKKWQQKCQEEVEEGPLSKQFIPSPLEENEAGMEDPIGDQRHQVCDGLIHRYRNRVLFLPTKICPVTCRYCFRKHEIDKEEKLFSPDINEIVNYLQEHQEIEEIIFSGGDPFSLSDEKISFYLEQFENIPHIKWIRFHTRYPSMIPKRFTENLLKKLDHFSTRFAGISVVLHINHQSEWDEELALTMKNIARSNCQLLSQTVLLKGVNDCSDQLAQLFKILSSNQIRPYYLHHPDRVKGSDHFYLPLDQGRKIYHQLRDKVPGWMIPQYIIDIPGGFGKIPAMNADSHLFQGELVDRNGHFHPYP